MEDEPGQKDAEVSREDTLLRKRLVRLTIAVGTVLALALVVSLVLALRWYLSPQTDLSISQRQDLVQGLASAGQAVAVLLTGAVALIGLYLTRQNTNKQLRQARESTREQLEQARESTREQLEQARESQERTQASAQETLRLTEQGQITERFTRAIDQLGKVEDGQKLFEIRVGGIYALERIARESEEDYWSIMEILTAYARQNAPLPPEAGKERTEDATDKQRAMEGYGGKSETTEPSAPDPDIQAIMNILRRRKHYYMHGEPERLDLRQTNLSGADLSGADLSGADLREADLRGANLSGAIIDRANLREADLGRADLSGAFLHGTRLSVASLYEADLRGAHLSGGIIAPVGSDASVLSRELSRGEFPPEAIIAAADLSGADLRGADLSGAIIADANLSGARLSGADLSGAQHLTQEQLEEADGDEHTQLPPYLTPPAHWDVKTDEQPEED